MQISPAGASVSGVELSVNDAGGDALAVWSRTVGSDDVAQASERALGGGWQAPDDLSAAGDDARQPTVVQDADGRALVSWVVVRGAGRVASAAQRAPDGTWGPAVDLATGVQDIYEAPAVAFAPGGNATALVQDAGPRISVADFDAATPTLGGLVAPATGVVGAPLSFSVVATGATGPATWDFGDGATASGASVTHAFTTPGTKAVTVRAADDFGPPATLTATVEVTEAPGGGGGGGSGGGSGGGNAAGGGASGGGTPPPPSAPFTVRVTAPAQRLATLRRTGTLKATCLLIAPGTCRVRATVTPATARALGLRVPRGAKFVTLASGSTTATTAGTRTVMLRLPKAARARIAKLRRSLPVALTATATARDGRKATATGRMTLR